MNDQSDTRPLTVGDWMVTLLILAIPMVNIIMMLVWAFSSTGNLNRRNYCLASLLWFVIMVALAITAFVLMALLGWVTGSLHHP